MRQFIIRRLLQSLVLLWLVMTASFLLVYTTSPGPEATLLGSPNLTQQQIEAAKAFYGLNDPLYVQYWRWFSNTVTLNFGTSYTLGRPVTELIWSRLGPTFQLGVASYVIGMVGIGLGLYAARQRGKLGDSVIRVGTVLGSAMPNWWLAILVVVVLSNTVHWFPQGEGKDNLGAWFIHLLIPAAILSSDLVIRFTRYVRSETLEVLEQDYVRTARAKGLSERAVMQTHVVRNTLIPVITLLGAYLPRILSGAIIMEQIFNWPGIGRLLLEATNSRDYPLVMALLLMGTFITITGTLLADIAYGLADPRVQYN